MAEFIPFPVRKANFKYASGITITTSAALDTFFSAGTDFSGVIKDASITPPNGAVSQENFAGEDANGFQNARFNEDAFEGATMTGTMIVDSAEVLESLSYGTPTSVSTSHNRYRPGDGSRPTDGAILLNLDNGTNECNYVLNNIVIEMIGDVKMTGTDGHWEQDFTIKCLPKDFHGPEYDSQ